MPRTRKHKEKAARKSAVAAATYAERDKECQSQHKRQHHERDDSFHGEGENKWSTSNGIFRNQWLNHRLRRRNSDTDIYNNKHKDHFLRRNRSRSPFTTGGAGSGDSCRRPYLDERRRGGRGGYSGPGDTSNKNKRKVNKYDKDVRTLYQRDLRSHRYDRVIRDVYIQGNHLKEGIKDMLEGLAKLQPDPEEMEWERTNPIYYVSEVPPKVPRAGLGENGVSAVGAEGGAGLRGWERERERGAGSVEVKLGGGGGVGGAELEGAGVVDCRLILGCGGGLGDVLGLIEMERRRGEQGTNHKLEM